MVQLVERLLKKRREDPPPPDYNRAIEPAKGIDRERVILNCRELLEGTEFTNQDFLNLLEYLIALSGGNESSKTTPYRESHGNSFIRIVRKGSGNIEDAERNVTFSFIHTADVNSTWAMIRGTPANLTDEKVREADSPINLSETIRVQHPRYESNIGTASARTLTQQVHIPPRMNIPAASGVLTEGQIPLLSQGDLTLNPECTPHILRRTSERAFDAVVKNTAKK